METESNLDVIGVLRTHLEEIHVALRNAKTREESLDLSEDIRRGRKISKPSWLTRDLTRAIEHTAGYLSVRLEDEDVPED